MWRTQRGTKIRDQALADRRISGQTQWPGPCQWGALTGTSVRTKQNRGYDNTWKATECSRNRLLAMR